MGFQDIVRTGSGMKEKTQAIAVVKVRVLGLRVATIIGE